MKSRVLVFILLLLGCLTAIPILNVMRHDDAASARNVQGATQGFLERWYNLDVFLGSMSSLLYPLGISIDPDQVVIGRDGWLFLGNAHDTVISANSMDLKPELFEEARLRDATLAAWEYWYSQQGIVFLGQALLPNKETIYSNKTPKWASPKRPSKTDALISMPFAAHYFDARPGLIEEELTRPEAGLYFKTDTHWNAWGGWLGYLSLGKWLKRHQPEIGWPVTDDVSLKGWSLVPGGDLARFLRIGSTLKDQKPEVDTSKLEQNSLNPQKKLLWLRDSFGDAWEPYITATFSDVSVLHWREALSNGAVKLLNLVKEYKPDYILYSVVERSAYAEQFKVAPPLLVLSPKRDRAEGVAQNLKLIGRHHLEVGKKDGWHKVTGNDPFLEYEITGLPRTSEFKILSFELECKGQLNQPVQMQIFWTMTGSPDYVQDKQSVAYGVMPGASRVYLGTSPQWLLAQRVGKKLRIDVESTDSCKEFMLDNVALEAIELQKN